MRELDGPIYVRQGSLDWVALREVLLEREYHFALRELSDQSIRQIVDLGANVGFTVRLWQQRFPEAAVVAVEPAAESLAMCRLNADLAGKGAIRFLATGVAATPGRGWLDRSTEPMTYRTRSGEGCGEPVDLMSMEEILAAGGVGQEVDLLKCDIEGAEREIFAECRGWIHRIHWLLIELHDGYRVEELVVDLFINGVAVEEVARKKKKPPVEVALLRLAPRPI